MAAGGAHSCALAGDGTVQCWGAGSWGRLGNGGTSQSSVPVDVVGLDDATDVTAGLYHSCALRANGAVVCWGYNAHGQLGDGSTDYYRTTPSPVVWLNDAVSISAGSYHTCAARVGGNAVCWGYGAFGELGDDDTSKALIPRTVGRWINFIYGRFFIPETDIVDVDAGQFFSCARTSHGTARCWGRNHLGQLGDGTTTQRTVPTTVQLINDAVDITAGDGHACAVRGDSSVWCWGSNSFGQLGDGSTNNSPTPRQSTSYKPLGGWYYVRDIRTVSAGGWHTCVTTQSGRQRCSGRNDYSQLSLGGNGTYHDRFSQPFLPAVQTSAGKYHTCIRQHTGAVMCLGLDNSGQAGGIEGCPSTKSLALVDVRSITGDTLSKAGIHYLTGNGADLTLVASECTVISRVMLNGLALSTAPDPIEYGPYYQVLSQISLGDGTKRIIMRLHSQSLGNGARMSIQVAVGWAGGGEAVIDTMAVQVQSVIYGNPNADYVGPLLHLSQNEIRNQVFASIYGLFGDNNYYKRSGGADLYDFHYGDLTVGLSTSGVTFRASAEAKTFFSPCDPTVTVDGTFQIVQDGTGGITTDWVIGPNIDTDFPFLCDVIFLGITVLADEFINWQYDDNFERKIDKRIRRLGDVCGLIPCDTVVQAINHMEGLIEIQLKPIIDAVTIRNRYGSDAVKDGLGLGLRGMMIPANQHLIFSTSELVQTCATPASTSDCDTRIVSGTGVFNFEANPPVPSPWGGCTAGGCLYYGGRQGPWDNMLGARRDPALLPLPAHSVAALVGRTASETDGLFTQGAPFFAGDFLCMMPKLFGVTNSLAFGRNDHDTSLGQDGTGHAIVTIGFVPEQYAGFFDPCEN